MYERIRLPFVGSQIACVIEQAVNGLKNTSFQLVSIGAFYKHSVEKHLQLCHRNVICVLTVNETLSLYYKQL